MAVIRDDAATGSNLSGITRDGAVGEDRRAVACVHAASRGRLVARDGAVGEGHAAVACVHTAAIGGSIARDGAVAEGELAAIEYAAARAIAPSGRPSTQRGLPNRQIPGATHSQQTESRRTTSSRNGAAFARDGDGAGHHRQPGRPVRCAVVGRREGVGATRRQHDGVRPAASLAQADGVVGVGRGDRIDQQTAAADVDGGGQRRRLAERQQQGQASQGALPAPLRAARSKIDSRAVGLLPSEVAVMLAPERMKPLRALALLRPLQPKRLKLPAVTTPPST